jgi:hypothetical protein
MANLGIESRCSNDGAVAIGGALAAPLDQKVRNSIHGNRA